VVDPGDPVVGVSREFFCKSRTKSTKSATSTIVDHTCSCDFDPRSVEPWQDRCASTILWLASRLENDFTARDVYSIRPLGHEASVWQDHRYQRMLTKRYPLVYAKVALADAVMLDLP